ncbi:MAG: glycine cleavage system aminomethyltransferase GcvT [Spirochaetaceae bacterium]|jgi:aminomethyltransferase|nr:glycine cleavage system aminomethyltransferase GcvT [Spirochaetaceae bacterium]
MEKKTPLYQWHQSHGGKIVPFAGYLLPVQYAAGVITEHQGVRTKAGLFDVSHMGELEISGQDALSNLQNLLSNDFTNMTVGRVRYTLMCNDSGGIVDDLVVCKMEETRYILVVNAANRDKDYAWVRSHLFGKAACRDISDSLAQIALQGPASPGILAGLSRTIPEKYYTFIEKGTVGGINCIVSRTGYTGELGYELYCPAQDAEALWEKLLAAGKDAGLIPCGLGARDTLRLEAAMPLYGHEMTDEITPFEAALHFAVKMDKGDFIGKKALAGHEKPARTRVGLRVTGRGIARGGEDLFLASKGVGKTTSGTFCPFLQAPLAMALVNTDAGAEGTVIEVDIRGKRVEAEVVPLPFYKRP